MSTRLLNDVIATPLRDDPPPEPTTPPVAPEWFDSLNGGIKSTFDTYHLPFVVRNADNTAGNYDH